MKAPSTGWGRITDAEQPRETVLTLDRQDDGKDKRRNPNLHITAFVFGCRLWLLGCWGGWIRAARGRDGVECCGKRTGEKAIRMAKQPACSGAMRSLDKKDNGSGSWSMGAHQIHTCTVLPGTKRVRDKYRSANQPSAIRCSILDYMR